MLQYFLFFPNHERWRDFGFVVELILAMPVFFLQTFFFHFSVSFWWYEFNVSTEMII